MLYLSPIYVMLHLLCQKTLIYLKGFTYYRKRFLRIMFFQNRNCHAVPIVKVSKILKSFDKTTLENCIFISKSLKRSLPCIFNNWFKFSFESHSHNTRWPNLGYLKYPLIILKPMKGIVNCNVL